MKTKGLPINGILLLDKPVGISSNSALQKAKRLFNAQKAGHTGSLDPLASGMLPVCFGEATKFSRFLLDERKSYSATLQLGVATSTGDREGEVIEEMPFVMPTQEILAKAILHFCGEISQIPPMYSALKFQGKCLYELARKGKVVERAPRKVTIYELEFTSLNEQGELSLRCVCSKGTYIRTLVEDLGKFLGSCAHLVALRRLWVHPFKYSNMISYADLEAVDTSTRLDKIYQLEEVVAQLIPKVPLSTHEAAYLQQGRFIRDKTHQPGWVSLFCNSQFLGVGEILADGSLVPRRMIQLS